MMDIEKIKRVFKEYEITWVDQGDAILAGCLRLFFDKCTGEIVRVVEL
jgi:hypothetical protein